MKNYVVIVDAYSAGNLLAPEFKRRGYDCIHVQSTSSIWKVLAPSFRIEDFEHNFAYQGSLQSLVKKLERYQPLALLPGTETGVPLADSLAEALGLPGNGSLFSLARRDKFQMVETVAKKGLLTAKQIQSSNAMEIMIWKQREKLPEIVIKPLNSAGTDNVYFCKTESQILKAVKAILGTTNMLGLANKMALAQERLIGTEYFVDTVSRQGKHHFTDIWEYQKRSINGSNAVYDRNELISFDNSEALRNYTSEVLDALGIKQGAAHTEVILTDRGPALVECGARMDGLSVPSVNEACIGYSPLELTVDSYVDPEAFAKKVANPYPILKNAYTVYLTSYEEGEVQGIPGQESLEKLESFFQMRMRVKPGSVVHKTKDYFTAPGFLTLVHENKEQLERDYQTIRKLEKNGLFEITH